MTAPNPHITGFFSCDKGGHLDLLVEESVDLFNCVVPFLLPCSGIWAWRSVGRRKNVMNGLRNEAVDDELDHGITPGSEGDG
jgi:hypothetical protein